jgi:hypothetical protein
VHMTLDVGATITELVRRARRQLHNVRCSHPQAVIAQWRMNVVQRLDMQSASPAKGANAYVGLLCDEQDIRALLAPCLHPFVTASIFR